MGVEMTEEQLLIHRRAAVWVFDGKSDDWEAHRNFIFDYMIGPITRPGAVPLAKARGEVVPLDPALMMRYPQAWFMGILLSWLMRPNAVTRRHIAHRRSEIGLDKFKSGPLDAAVHIRRTDKVTAGEAKSYLLREYLRVVTWRYFPERNYFTPTDDSDDLVVTSRRLEEQGNTKKEKPKRKLKIFVATDDPKVMQESRAYHSDFIFVFNNAGMLAASASHHVGRLTDIEGLRDAVVDAMIMGEAKVFVGTFSSQLSRVGFEIRSVRRADQVDPSEFAFSLDQEWYGRL
eukprot:Selendium_serpulae@DN2544_c0_g1_i2.p1